MRIEVTQKHIRQGRADDPCYCPIGLALKEMFPDKEINVTDRTIRIGSRTAAIPDKARRFIELFDHKKEVHPISFSIKLWSRA